MITPYLYVFRRRVKQIGLALVPGIVDKDSQ
jgi:hypothetical protein